MRLIYLVRSADITLLDIFCNQWSLKSRAEVWAGNDFLEKEKQVNLHNFSDVSDHDIHVYEQHNITDQASCGLVYKSYIRLGGKQSITISENTDHGKLRKIE